MIFQGQEIFEIEPFSHAPMNWDRFDRYEGIFTLYRDLIRLRRNWFDNTTGLRGHGVRVHHHYPGSKVLAFHRWEHQGPGDDVVVVMNFENRYYPHYEIGFPRPGNWIVRLNTDGRRYDQTFGDFGVSMAAATPRDGGRDGYPCQGFVAIGPYDAMILSQDR